MIDCVIRASAMSAMHGIGKELATTYSCLIKDLSFNYDNTRFEQQRRAKFSQVAMYATVADTQRHPILYLASAEVILMIIFILNADLTSLR